MAEALVKNWYVVRAVSGQENKVKSYIENEIARLGFSDYVDEVLVPTEKVVQVRNGKKINKERVLPWVCDGESQLGRRGSAYY